MNRGKEAAVVVPYDFYERALAALGEEAKRIDMVMEDGDGNVTVVQVKDPRPKGH